jgi:hypothetical protein
MMRILLVLMIVCCFHCDYAMDTQEKLMEARAHLMAAEYRIDGMSILTNYSHHKYMESQLREALDWVNEASNLSQKVLHDRLASIQEKKEAQLLFDRAYSMRGKYTVKL